MGGWTGGQVGGGGVQERACGIEDLKKRLGGSVQKGVCYVGGRVWVKGGMKGGECELKRQARRLPGC